MNDPDPGIGRGELALAFARVGSLAWGGGGATLAMLHSEFCLRRRLVSEEEFQVLFGLSRMVPGMNLLALTVLLGYRVHGVAGSFLALTGLTVPSFTLILLGCLLVRGSDPHPLVAAAVRGLMPATVALLLYTGWRLCADSVRRLPWVGRGLWLGLAALAAAAAHAGLAPPALVVIGGAAAGVALGRWIGGRP